MRMSYYFVIIVTLIANLVSGLVGAEDTYEPNNSASTPSSFVLSDLAQNLYLSSGDEDWYLVSCQPGLLHVRLDAPPLSGQGLNLLIANGQGGILYLSTASSLNEDLLFHIDSAGNYAVGVAGSYPISTSYALTINQSMANAGDDADEASAGNDCLTTATPISINATRSALVLNDDDWYKIVAPNALNLVISTDFNVSAGNVDLKVYDANGVKVTQSLLAGGAATGQGRSVAFYPTKGATYYVCLTSGVTNSYSGISYALRTQQAVLMEDQYEPNNTAQTAQSLTLGTYNLTALDVDWFSVQVTNPGLLNLSMTYPSAGSLNELSMVLTDSAGVILASGGQAGQIRYHADSAGTFYVQINPINGGTNSYTLTLGRTILDDVDDVDDAGVGNDSFATAIPISVNANRSGLVLKDDDWYKIVAPNSLNMTIAADFTVGVGNVDLKVYDANGAKVTQSLLSGGAATGQGRSVAFYPAKGATYYVCLTSGATNSYSGLGYALRTQQTVLTEDQYEPNNTVQTAQSLALGTYNLTALDADWFSVQVTDPGLLYLNMTYPSGGSLNDLAMVLTDSVGNVLANGGQPGQIRFHADSAGTYYVQINPVNGGTNSYALTLARTISDNGDDADDADDAGAGNDSFATAISIPVNASRSSLVLKDDDWYKIIAPTPQNLTVAVDFAVGSVNIDLKIYDANGVKVTQSLLASGVATGLGRSVSFFPVQGATYYVCLTSGATNSYSGLSYVLKSLQTVVTEDLYEPNNTVQTAKSLALGTYNLACLNPDWFSFQITDPGLVYVSLTNPDAGLPNDLAVVMTDSVGTVLANGGQSKIIRYHADLPGTVFVHVEPINGGVNTYTLTIARSNLETADDADDAGPGNDSFSAAGPIALNTTRSSLILKDDDWYTFTTSTNQSLKISALYTLTDGNVDLQVYDSNGIKVTQDVLAQRPASGLGRVVTFIPISGSTYKICVNGGPLVSPPGLTYALKTEQLTLVDDAMEPNNTLAQAISMTPGSYRLVCMNEDWFKIDVADPGQVYVRMEHPVLGAVQDLNLSLTDSLGNVVASGGGLSDKPEVIWYHAESAGTYYIRIVPTNGGSNTYDLTYSRSMTFASDDAAEDDDILTKATVLANYSTPVTGRINNDEDWYTVVVPQGTFNIRADYDTKVANLQMDIFTASGLLKRSSDDEHVDATGKTLPVDLLGAQQVWISVRGGVATPYTFSIDHPTTWTTKLPFGPAAMTPPTIAEIDGDGRKVILVGGRKTLDDNDEEVRPGGLACLEADGRIRWTTTFPAFAGPDPLTFKTYKTTSPSTRAVVADVDGDGIPDILIGVGGELDTVSKKLNRQHDPGSLGGIYCLNSKDGSIKWFRQGGDMLGSIPGRVEAGDGLPDGVVSTPAVVDMDGDGTMEVAWGCWDQRVYLVHGKDGTDFNSGWPQIVFDTEFSSPSFVDVNNDGLLEMIIGGDVTANESVGTQTGGIFHVYDRMGRKLTAGFRSFVPGTTIKGKFEEVPVWSSPVAGDLDGDGNLEIVYGTGTFDVENTRNIGNYLRVWQNDGQQRFKLTTSGRVSSIPLICDLDGDGKKQIIATSYDGYLMVWEGNGVQRFNVRSEQSGGFGGQFAAPIFSSPLAADLDGDGKMEIIFSQGHSLEVYSSTGTDLIGYSYEKTKFKVGLNVIYTRNTPAVGRLAVDAPMSIIVGGAADLQLTQGMVYCFQPYKAKGGSIGRGMISDAPVVPLRPDVAARAKSVADFVTRFYDKVLNRLPDAGGLADWRNRLLEGDRDGAAVARGFVLSQEFIGKNRTNDEFVEILYSAFFNRTSDPGGKSGWMNLLQSGGSEKRIEVLNGFIDSLEFQNLCKIYGISPKFSTTGGILLRATVEELILRYYVGIIKRDATPYEIQMWTDRLILGTHGPDDLALELFKSSNYTSQATSTDKFIDDLYFSLYGYRADTFGLNYWADILANVKADRSRVVRMFLQTDTFAQITRTFSLEPIAGSPSNEDNVDAFVTRFYKECLGRNPDYVGLNDWSASLLDGSKTGRDIGYGIALSGEFKNLNKNDSDFVDVMYNAFFARSADPGGKSNWIGQINQDKLNGLNVDQQRARVLEGFFRSQEFKNLCDRYGIIPYPVGG